MGKIVKFCSSCEEGFAEKFTFCPDCGASLQAFEMNPLVSDAEPVEEIAAAPVAEALNFLEIPGETVQEVATAVEFEPVDEPAIEAAPPAAEIETVEEPFIEAAPPEAEIEEAEETVFAAPATKAVAASSSIFFQSKALDADRKPASFEAEHDAFVREGQFYVTVIEEKNVKQRNTLLFGSTALIVGLAIGLTIWSLFKIPLTVYAIGDDNMLASMIDNVPMVVDEEEKFKKDKDTGGGGGGGGNEDPNPVSKGERAPMRIDPQFAPSVSMNRLTNPTIPIQMAIKGPINEYKINTDRYGVKFGADQASDGPGMYGGQGGGRNGGQGNNDGPGAGLGNNGGIGGPGSGGMGPGGNDGGIGPPPPKRASVTKALAILSKPRPGYTDSARQANIQGTVILRVTFLGSGQIGSISAVKGLPNGLTEQAIAAARRISFTPKMVDGYPQPVTKQIEYTFSIY